MADEVLSRACVKSLEIIGEASRNISDDLKKLFHHYFGVDWEIVDDALKNELPKIRLSVHKKRLQAEAEAASSAHGPGAGAK